jgi:pilus assembly protein Flp/PilA
MNCLMFGFFLKIRDLMSREEGQDLVEYALVVALVTFGATAGMSSLATGLNKAFQQVSTNLGKYIT